MKVMDDDHVSNKTIYELLQSVLKKSEAIEQQLITNTNELKEEIRNINVEFNRKLEYLEIENDEIKKENQNLRFRLLAAERKLKKYNLVFYGIQERESGIAEVDGALNILKDMLGTDIQFSDVRDIYRIGKKVDNKDRPLIIEVVNYQLKQEIFRNTKKLKGTGIFVCADYIPEDYKQQITLRKNLKIAKDKNLDAQLKNNTLVVEGEVYTYEELKDQEIHIEVQEKTDPVNNVIELETIVNNLPRQIGNDEEEFKKKKFNELINGDSRRNKRKGQPEIIENQVKRSTRFAKK